MGRLLTAKEPTLAEVEERRELCFALHRAVVDAVNDHQKTAWALAKALYEFDEEVGWRPLGYESLQHYLADPEVGLTRQTYERYRNVYRDLAVTRRVPMERLEKVAVTKVDIVRPALVRGEVSSKQALDDAESMGFRDLREEYQKSNAQQLGIPDEPSKVVLPETEEPVDLVDVDDESQRTDEPVSGEVVVEEWPDIEHEGHTYRHADYCPQCQEVT